jgi:hypothetical protein
LAPRVFIGALKGEPRWSYVSINGDEPERLKQIATAPVRSFPLTKAAGFDLSTDTA